MMTIEERSHAARKVHALEEIASALQSIDKHLVEIINRMRA